MGAELIRHPRHQFWPDSLSLVDHSGVDASRLLAASQLTDTYLLALAAARGGRLASFDRDLSCTGVAGGRHQTHWVNSVCRACWLNAKGGPPDQVRYTEPRWPILRISTTSAWSSSLKRRRRSPILTR